ncbi:hypothetical protein [Maridesulfovibrio bastinii]|uniref:hypothetical protein n=1 Tax=Maridesulfovibrio bastinii TaxID=47157 RepID=UPI001B7FC3A9|nr:hypothetical protein [Maridesulfovibrio bastinii]
MSHWALWLGADGVHWGDHDEDGSMPEIATAAGLIRHIPSAAPHSMGEVETFLLPDMLHSHKFLLQDTRRGIDDQFRALRVLHEITPTSARTRLGYGEEYGRY